MEFISTFEKQLDSKRRFVVPQEFRAAAAEGVFIFPSFEADCIEGGGRALRDRYRDLIEAAPFGDPLRLQLETTVFGGMFELAYDGAGRIVLPESLCDDFGIGTDIALVGLRERFQIWPLEAFKAHRASARAALRQGVPAFLASQRAAKGAAA